MRETSPLLSPASSSSSISSWGRLPLPSYGSVPLPPTKIHHQEVVVDDIQEEYVLQLRGFRASLVRLWLSRALYCVSLGTVYLFCRWFPSLGARLTSAPCSIDEADLICIVNPWGEVSVSKVYRVPLPGGRVSDVFPSKKDPVHNIDTAMESISFFYYNSIKFILNPSTLRFETILNWRDPWWGFTHDMSEGLGSVEEVVKRLIIFDHNTVEMEKYPLLDLLMEELLNPIFIFQGLCMVQWFSDEYESYGYFIMAVSLVSIVSSFRESQEKDRLIHGMCQYAGKVRVKRMGLWHEIEATDLVPGDIIEIGAEGIQSLPCDAVLVSGSCIMNESMLTGESKPVLKSAILPDELAQLDFSVADPSNSRQMSRFFLFFGTKVVRVRGAEPVGPFHSPSQLPGAMALVVRTGVNTTKGCLVRSIMYPKPHTFKYVRDSLSYIVLLTVVTLVGAFMTVCRFYLKEYPWDVIILRTGDLFTIAVPVALPATIAIGVGFSIRRLRRIGIYCLAADRVNVCGQIEVMCFDKTGTLTHEGMDILGFRCAAMDISEKLNSPHDSSTTIADMQMVGYPKVITAMASCHSIKVLDGELIGDPIDLKVFELSGWEIEEGSSGDHTGENHGFTSLIVRPPTPSDFKEVLRESVRTAIISMDSSVSVTDGPSTSKQPPSTMMETEIGVIRSFEFESRLRRMSVITRKLSYNRQGMSAIPQTVSVDELLKMKPTGAKEFDVYCKGAPEVILTLCDPSSVPHDYSQLLHRYAHHGYHVIALATKVISNVSWLKLMRMRREDVERELEFLGFIVFENKLKSVTESVVSTLHAAKIRQVMCTGDNIRTAISVARDCGIVKQGCRVFVPRFESENRGSDAVIIWEDVDQDERSKSNISMQLELDPVSMRPVIAIKTTDILDPEEADRSFVPERFVEVEIRDEYQLAVTGDVFAWMLEHSHKMNSFFRMLIKAQVFARMSPEQKKLLVSSLQQLGYCVGFCGDGANDWGALQAADVGVSLSEVELSVAAPFTSKCNSIACIVNLIKEGRASLVTSFGSSKYLIVNGLIQFSSVMILYTMYTNLGNNMFPYIDLVITVPVAIFMSESGPHDLLDPKRPTSSFASKKVMFSVVGQALIQAIMQYSIFFHVKSMPFYIEYQVDISDDNYRCYENTCVFLLSAFQYLFVAAIYCDGAPYREDFWRNTRFIITITCLLAANLYLTLIPSESVLEYMDLITLPLEGKLYVLCFAALNLIVSSAAEVWILPIGAKLAGWAWIEYSTFHDEEDEIVDDAGPSTWSESTRAIRREKAIRKKWKQKGKLYKIVEQDLEYY
ncbi:hypothetical protein BDR26DRAFT_826602 [Obelidium mucronatum]|nr:hypothetical protein BDR26DRAFT_826602 [Obelidium mucronatum]